MGGWRSRTVETLERSGIVGADKNEFRRKVDYCQQHELVYIDCAVRCEAHEANPEDLIHLSNCESLYHYSAELPWCSRRVSVAKLEETTKYGVGTHSVKRSRLRLHS